MSRDYLYVNILNMSQSVEERALMGHNHRGHIIELAVGSKNILKHLYWISLWGSVVHAGI